MGGGGGMYVDTLLAITLTSIQYNNNTATGFNSSGGAVLGTSIVSSIQITSSNITLNSAVQ